MEKFSIFRRIVNFLHRLLDNPTNYAKYLGVNIGANNLIGKMHWSSEPYLITVGNNCQLTNCRIFTHGGGKLLDISIPNLIFSVK